MGAFAEAFGYTPDEFRALRFADYSRLRGFLVDRIKQYEKAKRR